MRRETGPRATAFAGPNRYQEGGNAGNDEASGAHGVSLARTDAVKGIASTSLDFAAGTPPLPHQRERQVQRKHYFSCRA
jgi:hypothetical protein